MFSLSAPYHLSQSSETWSSMMSPGYLGPEDAYYTNQPTIHSGMSVEELQSLTQLRLEGNNVYYDLPSQPVGSYGGAAPLYVPTSGCYYDNTNYSLGEEMEEVRATRAWSAYSRDSTDSPLTSDTLSDHEGSPIRTYSLNNTTFHPLLEPQAPRRFSEADGALRSCSFFDQGSADVDDGDAFTCGSPNHPIDIDAFFDFKSNYYDVCAQHLRGSCVTSSPIHA